MPLSSVILLPLALEHVALSVRDKLFDYTGNESAGFLLVAKAPYASRFRCCLRIFLGFCSELFSVLLPELRAGDEESVENSRLVLSRADNCKLEICL